MKTFNQVIYGSLAIIGQTGGFAVILLNKHAINNTLFLLQEEGYSFVTTEAALGTAQKMLQTLFKF